MQEGCFPNRKEKRQDEGGRIDSDVSVTRSVKLQCKGTLDISKVRTVCTRTIIAAVTNVSVI